MAELIRTRLSTPDRWLALLSEGRRDKVREKFAELRESNMFTEMLAATGYCDKRTIVVRASLVPEAVAASPDQDLKSIERLRNSVAHADAYADTPEQAAELSKAVRLCQTWIDALQADIKVGGSAP